MFVVMHSGTRVIVDMAESSNDVVASGYAIAEIPQQSLRRAGPPGRSAWKLSPQNAVVEADRSEVTAARVAEYPGILRAELASNLRTKAAALKSADDAILALSAPNTAQLMSALKARATASNQFLVALGKLMKREFGGEL